MYMVLKLIDRKSLINEQEKAGRSPRLMSDLKTANKDPVSVRPCVGQARRIRFGTAGRQIGS